MCQNRFLPFIILDILICHRLINICGQISWRRPALAEQRKQPSTVTASTWSSQRAWILSNTTRWLMQHPCPADLFLLHLSKQRRKREQKRRSLLLCYIHGFLRHVKQIETVCVAPRLYWSGSSALHQRLAQGFHWRRGAIGNPSDAKRMDSCWLEAWRAHPSSAP